VKLLLETLGEIVRNVAVIILLTTFLDMLLPNTKIQPFLKVVLGLFVMLAIITPVIDLLDSDYELTAWHLSLPTENSVNTVLVQGQEIVNLQQSQALVAYKERLEKQMESLVQLIPQVGAAQCSVEMEKSEKIGSIGRITHATFWVTLQKEGDKNTFVKPVEPVKIIINSADKGPEKKEVSESYREIENRILNLIANYYSVDKKNIKVIFY